MLRIAEESLTFDDVLLLPDYSEVLPREADLSTQLTRGIRLSIPLVSAAMDTVTEARLAIAIAQEGGVGILHKNMTPEQQADEVRKVKKYESGMIVDPITVGPATKSAVSRKYRVGAESPPHRRVHAGDAACCMQCVECGVLN